jgi:hypothetical protein
LEPTGPAEEQIRALLAEAAIRGELREVLAALRATARELKTRPQDWGDPVHRTHKEGGVVYHRIFSPLLVRYAVFESEKVVWLLNVRAMPGSPPVE